MGSSEKPNYEIRVRFPGGEGEGNGFLIRFDVVVGDEDGPCFDNIPGVESVVQAGGGRA